MSRWYDPWGIASDTFHRVTGMPTAAEKRERAKMINDQITSFKRQTDLAESELRMKRDQEVAEKRRIDEKKIRALRRNFRPAGFMDQPTEMTDKLGG